jgi:hypothetical protein
MALKIEAEVVAVYDLASIPAGTDDADDIRLRLEIVRNVTVSGKPLSARVWRKEHYRIKPSFQCPIEDMDDGYADEIILVRDVFLEGVLENVCGGTICEVLDRSITAINKALGLSE